MLVGNIGSLTPSSLLVSFLFFHIFSSESVKPGLCHLLTPFSLSPIYQAVIWLSTSLALVFVLLRALCRWHISQRISVDDALVYFASALLLSMAVLYTLVTPTMFTLDAISLGKQEPGPTFMGDAAFYLKCQFAIICLFWTTLWAVKVSILMFYKNLFNRLPKQMTLWWWVLGVVVVLYLGCWGSQLASCVPISGYFVIGRLLAPSQHEKSKGADAFFGIQDNAILHGTCRRAMIVCISPQASIWRAIYWL